MANERVKFKKSIGFIIGFLVVMNCLAWLAVYEFGRPQFLEVSFFDVGQGEAILIETSRHQQVLIDAGPDGTVLEKLNKELPFWDRTIELAILTHPESDHLAGLIEVLKRYKVKRILWTGVERDTAIYQEWEKALEKEIQNDKAAVKVVHARQKIILTEKTGPFLEILHPFENLAGERPIDSNNTSVVARLVFGKNSFLFTGDIYQAVEGELVKREGTEIDSDVLKVAHHGSRTSTSEELVKAVSPQMAVISAGKQNPYGHPHPEVLASLNKFAIRVLRTDRDGDIKIVSDGNNLKVKSKKQKQ